MRHQYLFLFALLFTTYAADAQIQLGPVQHYPSVEEAWEAEEADLRAEIEFFTGEPAEKPVGSLRAPCPTFNEGTIYLFPGDTINFQVDTSFLGGGDGSTLLLTECDLIDAGSVTLDTTALRYIADDAIVAGTDTVCVEFCPQEGDCFNLTYPVVVKRPGESYQLSEVALLAGEFLPEYCVDETVLPGELACNRLIDCVDDYEGNGEQIVYFDTYLEPTSCIRYRASQFAGVDEVCVVLCDEFTVCDTFRIPFRIVSDTLDLPFFDDFSYTGPYPDKSWWLDRDVFINNTMAEGPPSVGMATFDGIDRTGSAINTQFAVGDYLTSKYIDLSNTNGEVVLKFYLAPKGYGLYPNATDSLFVEFSNSGGEWVRVLAIPGIEEDISLDSVPPFQFYSLKVEGAAFKYDGFRFRFGNYISPGGLFDLWHLDYVYLNDNADELADFEDLAFSIPPGNPLNTYSSMPWWHFAGFVDQEFGGSIFESGFFNHFEQTVSVTESAIQLRETITDFAFAGSENVVDGVDANIPPKTFVTREKMIDPMIQSGYADDLATQFPDAEKVRLEVQYQFTQNGQDPLFFRNDTVRSYVHFDNYFAYDDGSAESYLFLENPQGVNPSLAIQYRTNVEDTLRAVQFHFPHVNGNVSDQLFNMRVYLESFDSEPVFEAIFLNPVYPDSKFDTLQGFTTYRLQNILGELTPVYLPADTDFFIEFQQATIVNDGIPIGFDRNNQREARMFANLGVGWESIPEISEDITGSLMIRPVVGDFTPPNTAVTDVLSDVPEITIYPNPGIGQIFINGLDRPREWRYRFLDNTGRTIREGMADTELNFSEVQAGWYVLQLIQPGQGLVVSKKVVIVK